MGDKINLIRKLIMTSKIILAKLNEALKKFGTYSFDDKGADEIMDIASINGKLRKLSPEKAGLILKEVINSSNKRGKALAECLVSDLDDMPEKWFNTLLEVSGAEY